MLDLQRLGDGCDSLLALKFRHAAHFHAERNVLADRHVWVERVRLEHHRDVAFGWVQVVDNLAADQDLAGADRLEARDRVEQSRLAAAGRPNQHEKAALLERDVDALEDFQAAEPLAERTDFESGHWLILSLRRPSGRARNTVRRGCKRRESAPRR